MKSILTIRQLIDSYLSERDIMPTSLKVYSYTIDYFFRWMVQQGFNAREPQRSDLVAYKRDIKDRLRTSTVDLYINSLKGFFRWLSERGIYDNITTGIRNEKRAKTFSRDPLTTDQVASLIRSIPTEGMMNIRDRAIIMLLYFNGLRVIEAARIMLEDVDLANNRIYIQGKGRSDRQPVEINSEVAQAISDYIQAKVDMSIEIADKDPLFTSMSVKSILKNLPLRNCDVSTLVANRLKAGGLKSRTITAHSLRHSAAVHMIDGGYDLYAVQLFLRHSDSNTSRIYTRYAEAAKLKTRQPTMFLQGKFQASKKPSTEIKT